MSHIYLRSTAATALILSLTAPAYAQIEDEIIVTGSPLMRSVDEAITGVSVLSGDELSNRLASTIGETLKSEPGVSSTYFGAGASRPIIRGQGGDRVRVLTNGIGSIDASSASPDHAVAAEPAQAERIEVLRGAALLRYGSSGSGGVVNVIDGRIPTELPDGVDGAVRIGASSVDLGREAAGSLDVASGRIVLHLDGTFKESDDYRIPVSGESREQLLEEGEEIPEDYDESRRLDNSAAKSTALTGGLSYIGDTARFGFAVHKFDSDYGIPGGHAHEEGEDDEDHDEDHGDEEEEEENVTIGLDQTRVDVNGAVDLPGFIQTVQLFGGYADYTHTEFEGPGEVGTVFTNEGYEVRVEAIQRERNGWARRTRGSIP
ncbi:TonB-dependent receptor plug domain-containing protein [Litorimonas sp. RW-G-Af-16]|uniref:TonB-dependent receptor plug domain-containing protein n=1 Tax=Litorimonas sp. RW-G-Af-16 TaxID=3241168 RepID=UPI003AAADB83